MHRPATKLAALVVSFRSCDARPVYDFGPADAFVSFGLSNKMYLVGHTLVWHSQTPNWVFAGTNPPPASATLKARG